MRFLLLNQTFYPDVVATAQHLSELAEELVKRGHAVTVVTGRHAYDNRRVSFAPRENWSGVEIHRVYSTGYERKTKWRRALDFASFLASCCIRLCALPRHDVVVALTTPPLISFLGAWRALLWRARFCYWVMDLNPDEAIAAGWLKADSLLARVLERMSRFSLRRAHLVIALDHFMKDRLMAKGISAKSIIVIPPWSHDEIVRFDASGRNQFRKTHALENKFVVMYSGNHSPVHPLETLLRAAESLKDHHEIAFCFIGGGSEFERVQKWASPRNANAVCLPYLPLNQLAASLSAADAHVVIMGSAFVGLVHPCKIYNILAVAAPVLYIGPHPSHVTEILERLDQVHASESCQHGEVQLATDHILSLKSTAEQRPREIPIEFTSCFSKNALLARMVANLECQ